MKRSCSLLLTLACLAAFLVGCSSKGIVAPTSTINVDVTKKEDAKMTVPEPKKHN